MGEGQAPEVCSLGQRIVAAYLDSSESKEVTPADIRIALGRVLYLIRLPTMDVKEFANGPEQSGVLDKDVDNTSGVISLTSLSRSSSRSTSGLR